MKRSIFILCILLGIANISAQTSTTEYINSYRNIAISEMNRTGVPASITLAQGILESASGNSRLAIKANNHFGIKCHSSWKGATIYKDDDRKGECFRKYKNASKSFIDHSNFLARGRRYAFLFDYKTTDYKKWAKGLKKAGYATNSAYARKLIDIIERYSLYKYDTNAYLTEDVRMDNPNDNKQETQKSKPKKLYKQKTKETFAFQLGRKIFQENKTDYIIAKKSDTYVNLTEEFEMFRFELCKYNDVSKGSQIKEGQRVYLKPKRSKTNRGGKTVHIVKAGDTPWSISQQYAVKLKKLCKRNNLKGNTKLQVGQKIKLR